MKKNLIIAFSFITLLLFQGCAKEEFDEATIYQKGAELTKLTRKVQVGVRKGITDENELETFIKERFSDTLEKFNGYTIFMKNDDNQAVVLMCDKNGKKALLEDIVCKAEVEGSDFFKKDLECTFHLDVKKECAR